MFDEHGHQRPPAPESKKYNLSIAEAGAMRMAGYIQRGQPHPCSRYGGMVDPAECAAWMRPLCSECSIGVIVRRKYPHLIPIKQEDQMPLQEPHMIDCPGCGRRMKHKGRGYCGRCYHYLRLGKRIPPLHQDAAPISSAAVTQDALGVPDDFANLRTLGGGSQGEISPTIEIRHDELVIDLSRCVDDGTADQEEVSELMAWIASEARGERRTPEAHVLSLLEFAKNISE